MAIGDNVFQVPPREGFGKSFILGENTALNKVLEEDARKRAEERAQQRGLQESLAKLSTLTADALPLHQRELIGKYQQLIEDYKDKRSKGETFKTGSDAQLDLMSKMSQLYSDAAKAKMYKDKAIELSKTFHPDLHEQESYIGAQKYLGETPLDKIDIQE